eukprot:Sspe_Gene.103718::Locus_79563_Transcript_1_1_Confidence_1.000_Length_1639::g.103718::m.103718/K15188/CCNT; cyclin T
MGLSAFPVLAVPQLHAIVMTKEAKGAEAVGEWAARRAGSLGMRRPMPPPVLSVADDHRLRVATAAFMWDVVASGRLSRSAVFELLLNGELRDLMKPDEVVAAFDRPGAREVRARAKRFAIGEITADWLQLVAGPDETEVARAEESLSKLLGVTVTRYDALESRKDIADVVKEKGEGEAHLKVLDRWRTFRSPHPAEEAAELRGVLLGIYIMHQYYLQRSFRETDRFLVAMASLLIAFKCEEHVPFRGLRDVPVLKFFSTALHEMLPDRYDPATLPEQLRCMEMAVLAELDFQIQHTTPHVILTRLCSVLAVAKPTAQLAVAVANDTYISTDLCLRYEPHCIAVTCLLVALSSDSRWKAGDDLPTTLSRAEEAIEPFLECYVDCPAERELLRHMLHPETGYLTALWAQLLEMYDPCVLTAVADEQQRVEKATLVTSLPHKIPEADLPRAHTQHKQWRAALRKRVRVSLDDLHARKKTAAD